MKKIIFKIFLLFMPIWAKFFKRIALTGEGTDVCIQNGFLPLPVHFYSPVPDLAVLAQRNVWDKKSDLSGIDFRPEQQVRLLLELGLKFGTECDWPPKPTDNPLDFYTENNSFGFGCAASLYTIIRNYQPTKIIEIGSGNSSRIITSAIARNMLDDTRTEYTVIDPYADPVIENLPGISRIIKEAVEITDIRLFELLGKNDILFIDSGHTVRTGSDVNFLYLDVLPRLSPDVIIHIHDISLPYEYPKVYFTNPSFRVFWTEAYLLQAFLCLNPHFEILLAMNYLMANHLGEFRKAFQHYDPSKHKATSGSFWMRRIS